MKKLPAYVPQGYIIRPMRSRLRIGSKLAKFIFRHKRWPWAITLVERVYASGYIIEWSQWHEWRHVQQWRWFGYVLFPLAYGIGALIGWLRGDVYWWNPFEVDACKYADRNAQRAVGEYPKWDYLLLKK